jgi:hypothetical protein
LLLLFGCGRHSLLLLLAAASTTIVEYLAAAYPDSGTALMPPDAYTAARVKLFSRYFAVRHCTFTGTAACLPSVAALITS